MINVILGWLRQDSDASRVVRLELDGDVLVRARASKTDQERLIELFVSRHSSA